jgi:signal transduction histidine kinase
MVSILQRTLGEDVTVKAMPSRDLWPALADPSQLDDAMLNLAVNARDAMPKGGQLVIETANVHLDDAYAAHNVDVTPGDYVALIVTDSGAGMSPSVIERVFEPFFTTKPPGEGTGLGLSVSYGIIQAHDGTISVESTPDVGATFTIALPLYSEAGK